MKALITALRTLTIIPVPGREEYNLASSLPFFPIVGALLGTVAAGVAFLCGGMLGWHIGGGVLALLASTFLTRGLHLDGLADTFDALGAGGNRENMLKIMKDPRTGSFGTAAIGLAFLLKAVAFARLSESGYWGFILVPFICSRMVQVRLAVCLPYARQEQGIGGPFVNDARHHHFLASFIIAAFLVCASGLLHGLVALVIAYLLSIWLASWMKRVFGGVTGDLLGMGGEVSEIVILLILAAVACIPL